MFCSLFRFLISHAADAGNKPGPVTARHLKRCSSCREFYDFCRQLDASLPADAEVFNCDIPAVLQEHILQRIDNVDTKTFKSRHYLKAVAIAAGLTMIILLGRIHFVKNQHSTLDDAELTIVPQNLPDIAAGLANINQTLENPLKKEYQDITNDAESAVRFLFACVNVDITGSAKIEKND